MSRKEIVSFLLLLVALISLLNATIFANVMPTHINFSQLGHQTITLSTSYICILYGLSTWLYHSNYRRPRRHMRWVQIAMLSILIVANIVTCYYFVDSISMRKVKESTDIESLLTPFERACKWISLVLSIVAVLLLFLSLVLVWLTAWRKEKERHIRLYQERKSVMKR
ncbi:uncharacterized protein LOC115621449 [Scaptodrosophila lebanonensis]|uniref:Uncharacterized protein LOC115621449 n=1 Tax=Drosophila lebanonensis TaxID=7225 RepID=A0A6J2T7P1_DROLE|nr:uncharacterized protein LOC115621449 [Scaptodrosophila lebanonensis]